MGLVYAEVDLINNIDYENARQNIIGQEEIRHINLRMLVDTGAYNLCINDNIQSVLQLPFVEKRFGVTADGRRLEMDVVGPVKLNFKNRTTSCLAMILPNDSEPLLGAIPLEDMDVLVHPQRLELIVNPENPYMPVMTVKGMRK